MMKEVYEKVIEIRRVSDRVMAVVFIFEDVMRLICGYVLQSGKTFEEKQTFCDLKGEWDMHSAYDLAMCSGDVSGHMGRHIDILDGVHGGYTWHKKEEKRKNDI